MEQISRCALIIEGETGVGKSFPLEVYSQLINLEAAPTEFTLELLLKRRACMWIRSLLRGTFGAQVEAALGDEFAAIVISLESADVHEEELVNLWARLVQIGQVAGAEGAPAADAPGGILPIDGPTGVGRSIVEQLQELIGAEDEIYEAVGDVEPHPAWELITWIHSLKANHPNLVPLERSALALLMQYSTLPAVPRSVHAAVDLSVLLLRQLLVCTAAPCFHRMMVRHSPHSHGEFCVSIDFYFCAQVHPGITTEDVKLFLSEIICMATKLERRCSEIQELADVSGAAVTVRCPEQVVFFDEMNTANVLGLLKEVSSNICECSTSILTRTRHGRF